MDKNIYWKPKELSRYTDSLANHQKIKAFQQINFKKCFIKSNIYFSSLQNAVFVSPLSLQYKAITEYSSIV